MKPILFNTPMVRALLEERKTATRRVVKGYALEHLELDTDGSIIGVYDQLEGRVFPVMEYAPYRPGDILYVRETWAAWSRTTGTAPTLYYKADGDAPDGIKWRPSIHMPREAARLFMRVTDVRVERLQDITEEQAEREGCSAGRIEITSGPWGMEDDPDEWTAREHFADVWNACYAKPRPVKDGNGIIDHYESYPWEDIQETRTYKGKPWYVIGNPWVWVIEYERCEKPEVPS